MKLYHYTCDHGFAGAGRDKLLYPHGLLLKAVWATDLDTPDRDALGLTSRILNCDRTEYRATVDGRHFEHWFQARRDIDPDIRDGLELAPGVQPGNWFVSFEPVPVLELIKR